MRNLENTVAWITGASSGIGRATAEALARHGSAVVLSARSEDGLRDSAAAIAAHGGDAVTEPLDSLDATAVDAVAARIADRFGRLDILVNNAGMNVPRRHWKDVSREGFEEVVGINLNGAFHCARAALPAMRARGDGLIVNVSSWAGRYVSSVTGPAYNAAKSAVLAMNESLNLEEGGNGIRACAVCPGEVATPILDRRPAPPDAATRARMLQPEDVAATILHVARMPPRACVNEIVISPTWNRSYRRMMAADG